MFLLVLALFFGIPLASVVFWVISLAEFITERKKVKKIPAAYDAKRYKKRKVLLIVSSVLAFILVAIVVSVSVLFYIGLRNM